MQLNASGGTGSWKAIFFIAVALCAVTVLPNRSGAQSSEDPQLASSPEASSTPCPYKAENDEATKKLCEEAAAWEATHPQAEPTPCPYQGTDRLLWAINCGHETRGFDPEAADKLYNSIQGTPAPSVTHQTMPDGTIVGSDGSVIAPSN